jgi:hypothetical protein
MLSTIYLKKHFFLNSLGIIYLQYFTSIVIQELLNLSLFGLNGNDHTHIKSETLLNFSKRTQDFEV